jgi:hypothetical protein
LQAIVFANTENSFGAALTLLENEKFANQVLISEYPILTALSRNTNPSSTLIDNFKSKLQSESKLTKYLGKLYLIYSALVKTRCQNQECDEATLVCLLLLFFKPKL